MPGPPSPKQICLLLTVDRRSERFASFLQALEERRKQGDLVYLYCLDEGIREIDSFIPQAGPQLRLFGCAYAAMRRSLPRNPEVLYGGLGLLADLISGTDELLAF
ncbi:conserved protein of unknown function [Methylacidimicrobium sp. AP8]|uniref:hypothetical protein n=1 Tax=Methylacidimicrobium sp. AP8 TaxID=2730359 RepID=UPI0018C088B5|nr:hypothetical protein [Methylacidimicrobium sp. AP8]CAB4242683.1 conserved protein of unknown function [Methylacidimicrobium sp. AP8]